jgi:kynurenine formamidase
VKLVDLTRRLDAADIERMPEAARIGASVLVPTVEHIAPDGRGAEIMCAIFQCKQEDLPDGEGWGDESLRFSSHLGTHVDAPLHYGSTCEGRPSRSICEIELEELFCDGVVLDLREAVQPGEGITVDALRRAIDANGATIGPGSAVLLRTGQERYGLADTEFYWYPGMTRAGTLLLAELGAKVLGTDAAGWDRPFLEMRRAFLESGDPAENREVFIVQQLDNLAALPPSGFKVGFFPLKLANCSASPARVVAFLD